MDEHCLAGEQLTNELFVIFGIIGEKKVANSIEIEPNTMMIRCRNVWYRKNQIHICVKAEKGNERTHFSFKWFQTFFRLQTTVLSNVWLSIFG